MPPGVSVGWGGFQAWRELRVRWNRGVEGAAENLDVLTGTVDKM